MDDSTELLFRLEEALLATIRQRDPLLTVDDVLLALEVVAESIRGDPQRVWVPGQLRIIRPRT
jgi:hypothetical protein